MTTFKSEADPVKESFFSAIEGLTQILPAETIIEVAKDAGWIKRIRKINPALFF